MRVSTVKDGSASLVTIRGVLEVTSCCSYHSEVGGGGQLKTQTVMLKENLERGSSAARIYTKSKLAQDRRAWGASIRNIVNSIGYASPTRSG